MYSRIFGLAQLRTIWIRLEKELNISPILQSELTTIKQLESPHNVGNGVVWTEV